MNTERNILLACFIGAALGAVIALQLHYLWWTGILAGGATGYLAYGFKDVIRAVLTALHLLHDTQFDGAKVKAGFLRAGQFVAILAGVAFCATSVIALSIIALTLLVSPPETYATQVAAPAPGEAAPVPHVFYAITALGGLILALALAVFILRARDKKGVCMAILGCIAATPLVLPFTLTAIFLTAVVPKVFRILVSAARQTFILIHSEMRVLCLTDSLLGALVGYSCGNALIGGVAGALLGWLNYRFVSVKWLKLAKA